MKKLAFCIMMALSAALFTSLTACSGEDGPQKPDTPAGSDSPELAQGYSQLISKTAPAPDNYSTEKTRRG